MPSQTRYSSTPEYIGCDDEEEESNTFFITPSTRVWEDSKPQVAKSRVDKVVGGHCLITNVALEKAVNYAHCPTLNFHDRPDAGAKCRYNLWSGFEPDYSIE
ncbi:hypothetical protein M422DRAFT_247855 [Sphaerobolus stellatus SS14]|nr:hypothetical protein M422DRAFT_247855 [Sphaerobolus stellatus SS14]